MTRDVIYLQPGAPAKPAAGQPCNGCGACCAWQPCPVGMILSRRRHGACVVLRFDEQGSRYRCGLMTGMATSRGGIGGLLHNLLHRLASRWIAAGHGCDFQVEAHRAP